MRLFILHATLALISCQIVRAADSSWQAAVVQRVWDAASARWVWYRNWTGGSVDPDLSEKARLTLHVLVSNRGTSFCIEGAGHCERFDYSWVGKLLWRETWRLESQESIRSSLLSHAGHHPEPSPTSGDFAFTLKDLETAEKRQEFLFQYFVQTADEKTLSSRRKHTNSPPSSLLIRDVVDATKGFVGEQCVHGTIYLPRVRPEDTNIYAWVVFSAPCREKLLLHLADGFGESWSLDNMVSRPSDIRRLVELIKDDRQPEIRF